jgi:hypothetical protein
MILDLCHCEEDVLPDEAISDFEGDCSPHWRTAQVSGKEQDRPRNDIYKCDDTMM